MNKTQRGSISMGVIALISLVVLGIVLISSYVSSHDSAVKYESNLDRNLSNAKLVMSSCTTGIRNISKVPDQYINDLEKVIQAEMNGRYGGKETDRVALFIQERGINVDSSMRKNIQREISACETSIKQAQQSLVDVKQDYETARNKFWSGTFMKMAGFPRKDLNQYFIVVDSSTNRQYETRTREDYDIGSKPENKPESK